MKKKKSGKYPGGNKGVRGAEWVCWGRWVGEWMDAGGGRGEEAEKETAWQHANVPWSWWRYTALVRPLCQVVANEEKIRHYLKLVIIPQTCQCSTRSADCLFLAIFKTRTGVADKAFSVARLWLWNSFFLSIRPSSRPPCICPTSSLTLLLPFIRLSYLLQSLFVSIHPLHSHPSVSVLLIRFYHFALDLRLTFKIAYPP